MAATQDATNLLNYATPAEPPERPALGRSASALVVGAVAVVSLVLQWVNAAAGNGIAGGAIGLFGVPVLGIAAIVVAACAAGFPGPRLAAWIGFGAGIGTVLGWLAFLAYLVANAWQCC